jgi:hypothetical protein
MNNINYMLLNDNEDITPPQSNNSDNDELCIICYDKLDCSGKLPYTLPECQHSFHQSCINAWFRQGNQKCPLCNDIGTGNTEHNRSYYRGWQDKFVVLRRLSKRKNAPNFLVKTFEKIKKKETSMKEYKDNFKEWKQKSVIIDNETTTIKDLIAMSEKKRRQCRTKEWNLRCYKRRLFEGMNIAPLILVERKKI